MWVKDRYEKQPRITGKSQSIYFTRDEGRETVTRESCVEIMSICLFAWKASRTN
jgi:hypothetical protein